VFFAQKDAKGNDLSDTRGVPKSEMDMKTVQTFLDDGWNDERITISKNGDTNAIWRVYEGESMPLLTAFLKTKDNISIVEYEGKRPVGTYGLMDNPSAMVSAQLNVYEDESGKKRYNNGYDYVSDVTCVVPKDEPTGTNPIDTNHAADNPKPFEPSKPFKPGKSIGSDTIATEDSIGKEYDNEIATLRHLETEKQESAGAAMESETDKLIVVGSGVRLPDAMSAEDLEAMLSEAEI
jgi:hypothetical protein